MTDEQIENFLFRIETALNGLIREAERKRREISEKEVCEEIERRRLLRERNAKRRAKRAKGCVSGVCGTARDRLGDEGEEGGDADLDMVRAGDWDAGLLRDD
jgi:hypothetical protein